jgi:hypothetical protein
MYPPLKAADFDNIFIVKVPADLPPVLADLASGDIITPLRTDNETVWLDKNGHKYQTRNIVCTVSNNSTNRVIPVDWFLDAIEGKITGIKMLVSDKPKADTDTPDRKRDIKSKKVRKTIITSGEPKSSKRSLAFALLDQHPGIGRQAAIRLLVENVGLTPAGGSTYYQLHRRK